MLGGSLGTNLAWNCSNELTSLTEASKRSFLETEDRCQKRGKVVMSSLSPPGLFLVDFGFKYCLLLLASDAATESRVIRAIWPLSTQKFQCAE